VAFTSDFKDRWGAEWLRWDSYAKFWSQLVRETMRVHDDDQFDFQVERGADRAKITISAIQADGQFRNKLQPLVRVVAPDGSASVVNVNQVGPGLHEATVRLMQKGSYAFRVSDGQTEAISRILPYSYPDEYHLYDPNIEFLRSISSETGGKFEPTPGEIFEAGGETTSVPMPLAPYFAGLVLLLFLVDVFLRRIRLFDSGSV
jgi:Ca-activated chloride channel family protein